MVLSVFIELQGSRVLVGKIVGNSDTAQFSYSQEYLANKTHQAISLSMPLQEESFSAEQTKCFFEGLLPEGFSRRAVAQWLHVDETDWLSILHGLGRECIGAIQIFSNYDVIPSDDYDVLTSEAISLAQDELRAYEADNRNTKKDKEDFSSKITQRSNALKTVMDCLKYLFEDFDSIGDFFDDHRDPDKIMKSRDYPSFSTKAKKRTIGPLTPEKWSNQINSD